MGYVPPPPPDANITPEAIVGNYPGDGLFKRVILGTLITLAILFVLAVVGFAGMLFMVGVYKWGPF